MNNKQSPLGYALLGYISFVVCLITLLPFRFQWPEKIEITLWWKWDDTIMNIILFIPLSFLFRLARGDGNGKEKRFALAFGLLVSLFIEAAQIFQSGRYSSPLDIMANGLGTWAGIIFHDYIKCQLNHRLVSRLALEMPLMNLFYLTGPLLWLNGLSTGDEYSHLYLTPIIGLFGGSILTSVWAYQLRPLSGVSANMLTLTTGVWFLCASLPGLLIYPLFIFVNSIGIILFVRLLVALLRFKERSDRRFSSWWQSNG